MPTYRNDEEIGTDGLINVTPEGPSAVEILQNTTNNKLQTLAQAKKDKLTSLASNYSDTDYTGSQIKHGEEVYTTGVHDFTDQKKALRDLFTNAQVVPSLIDGSPVTLKENYDDDDLIGPHRREEYSETPVPLNRWGQPDVRNAYLKTNDQGTVDTSDDVAKFGLARSDLNPEAIDRGMTPVDARYSDLREFWPYTGPRVVNGKDFAYDGTPGPATEGEVTSFDQTFLSQPITEFELNRYMDRATINARAMGTGEEAEKNYGKYGSGAHEYTIQSEDPLFTDGILGGQEVASGTVTPTIPYGYNKRGNYLLDNTLNGAGTAEERLESLKRGYAAEIKANDDDGYFGNLVDALQYGVGRTAVSTVDTAVDGLVRAGKEIAQRTSDVSEEEANKIISESAFKRLFNDKGDFTALDDMKEGDYYGYDDSRVSAYTTKFKDTMQDENASIVDKALVTLEAVTQAPEVLSTSSGDMILAALPGGTAIFGLNVTNSILEERQKIKGTSDLDASDYGIALTAGVISGVANTLTGGMAGINRGVTAKLIKDGISKLDKHAFAQLVTKVGVGTLEEASEESIQTLAEIAGTKFDTEKQDEILTKDTGLEVGVAAALGGGSGGVAAGTKAAIGSISRLEAITKEMERRAELKAKTTETNKVEEEMTAEEVKTNDDYVENIAGIYVKSQKGEELTAEDIDSMEESLKAVDESKFDDAETAAKLQKAAEIVRDSYRKRIETGEVTLGSTDDVLELFADAGLTEDNTELEEKIYQLASDQGVLVGTEEEKKEQYKQVKKDFYSVELDATTGKRGYISYGKELKALTTATIPDKRKVSAKIKSMQRFSKSQETYKKKAETALKKVETEIATYNGDHGKRGDALVKKIQSMGIVKNMNKKKDTLSIYVKKNDDGTLYISNKPQIEQIIEAKTRNIKGIANELSKAEKAIKGLGIKAEETGIMSGMTSAYTGKEKVRTGTIKRLTELGEKGSIKLITDAGEEGTYTADISSGMEDRTNTGEYTPEDTVYVAMNKPEDGTDLKAYYRELTNSLKKGGDLHKQITAAKKAGATIIVDNAMANTKLGVYTRKDGSTVDITPKTMISQAIKGFDVKYSAIGKTETDPNKEENGTKLTFKPKEIVDRNREEWTKKRERHQSIGKRKAAVAEKYTEAENLDTAIEEILAHKDTQAIIDEDFKGDQQKFENYLNNQRNTKVDEVVELVGVWELEEDRVAKALHATKIETYPVAVQKAGVAKYKKIQEGLADRKSLVKDIEAVRAKYAALDYATEEERAAAIESEIEELVMLYGEEGDLIANVLKNSYAKGKMKVTTKQGEKAQKLSKSNKSHIPVDVTKYVKNRVSSLLNSILPEKLVGEEYYKDMVDFIKKSQDLKKPYAVVDSPALGLVFDKDENVQEVVALAMQMGFDEYVTFSSNMLTANYKSKKDTAQMVGTIESALSPELYEGLRDKGVFLKTAANQIGGSILGKMGISFDAEKADKNSIEKEAFNRLAADIGNMAIMAGVKKGIVEYDSMTVNKYVELGGDKKDGALRKDDTTITFVKLTDKAENKSELTGRAGVDDIKDKFKELHEEIGDESTYEKGPSTRPIKNPRFEREGVAKDNIGTKVPDGKKDGLKSPKKFLQELVDTKWQPNVDTIKSVIELNGENRDVLLKYLGYTTKEDLDKLTVDSRAAQEAVNREIEKSIDSLVDLHKKLEENPTEMRSLYFDWFYTSNGRYMMDSNTINPQSDKLHRFMIQPESHELSYILKDGKLKVGKKDVTSKVRYALAQAFGIAVDKVKTKVIDDMGGRLLNIAQGNTETFTYKDEEGNDVKVDVDLATLEEMVMTGDETFEHIGFEAEHIGHTLQALGMMKKINNTKDGEGFSATLTAEFDAVTSGFGLKLMQFPILGKHLWKWLNKVGVFEKGSKFLIDDSMNDILAEAGFDDSYQTLAGGFDANRVDLGKGIKAVIWEDLRDGGLLPQKTAEGEISKQLRNLFKDPFMTFNYSAGIKSIRRSLQGILTTKVLDEIAKGNKEYDSVANSLAKFGKFDSVKELRTELRTKKVPYGIMEELGSMFDETYGKQVEDIMTENFQEFMQANDTINGAFKVMFNLFKEEYVAAKKQVDVGNMSEEKFMEIIDGLRTKFPLIKGPLSEGIEDGIGVYKNSSQTPSIEDERYAPAQTQTGSKKFGDVTKKVRHMIRDFEAAMSAGSVIPIHYIDGALMAQIAGGDITSIHDAIMPPLDMVEEYIGKYNQSMHDVNMQYNIAQEIQNMLVRAKNEGETDTEFKARIDRLTKDGVKIWVNEEMKSVGKDGPKASQILKEVDGLAEKVLEGKKALGQIAAIGHMAGIPGSMWYKDGQPVTPEDETGVPSRGFGSGLEGYKSLLTPENSPELVKMLREFNARVGTTTEVNTQARFSVTSANTITKKELSNMLSVIEKVLEKGGFNFEPGSTTNRYTNEKGVGPTVEIDKSIGNSVEEVVVLYHEMVHMLTDEYIADMSDKDQKVLLEPFEDLLKKVAAKDSGLVGKLQDNTLDRLVYILTSGDNNAKVAELMSVMAAEPDVRKEIVSVLEGMSKEGRSLLQKVLMFAKKLLGMYKEPSSVDKVLDIVQLETTKWLNDTRDAKERKSVLQNTATGAKDLGATKPKSKDKKGRIYEAKKEAEEAIPDEGCAK